MRTFTLHAFFVLVVLLPALSFAQLAEHTWFRRAQNTQHSWPAFMVADDDNNLYSTGPLASDLFFDTDTLGFFGGGSDAFVTKHDENGTLIWTNSFGTPGADNARGIVADGNGNVFLMVQTLHEGNIDMAPNETFSDDRDLLLIPPLGQDDATFLIKYNSDGAFEWGFPLETRADGRGDIEIDNNGDVYLASWYGDSIKPDPINDPTLRFDSHRLPQGAPARPGFVAKYNGDNGHLMWFRETNNKTYSFNSGMLTAIIPGYAYPSELHFDETLNTLFVFGEYDTELRAGAQAADSIFGVPNPAKTSNFGYFLWRLQPDGTPLGVTSIDEVNFSSGAPTERLISSNLKSDGSDLYISFNGKTGLVIATGDTLNVNQSFQAGQNQHNGGLLKVDATTDGNIKAAVAFNSNRESIFIGLEPYGDHLFVTARSSSPATYEHPTSPFTIETENINVLGPPAYRLDGFIWQLNQSDLSLVDSFRTEGPGDESFFDLVVKSPTEVFAATLFTDSLRFEGVDTVLGFNPSIQFWDAAWTRFSFPNVATVGRPETAINNLDFGLYPNPAGESVTLTFDASKATLRVFDPKGQLLQTRRLRSGERLDVRELPSGLYLLELTTENSQHTQRLLKQ